MQDNEPMVRSILMAFGSLSEAARRLGIPNATVYFWARNKNIPAWRRDEVLRAAGRRRITLTEAQKEYLRSKERFPVTKPHSSDGGSFSGLSEPEQHYPFAATPYNNEEI